MHTPDRWQVIKRTSNDLHRAALELAVVIFTAFRIFSIISAVVNFNRLYRLSLAGPGSVGSQEALVFISKAFQARIIINVKGEKMTSKSHAGSTDLF